MCGSDIFLGILAILFPPIAVWVKRGICSADSLINIALCCLGFLPGLLHAWYIIAVTPEPTYEELQDAEQGRVTYYYVHTQGHSGPASGGQSYGTVNSNKPINSTPNAQFPVAGAHQQGFVQPPTAASQTLPSGSGAPADDEVPPTYQQAVGDNKVQKP